MLFCRSVHCICTLYLKSRNIFTHSMFPYIIEEASWALIFRLLNPFHYKRFLQCFLREALISVLFAAGFWYSVGKTSLGYRNAAYLLWNSVQLLLLRYKLLKSPALCCASENFLACCKTAIHISILMLGPQSRKNSSSTCSMKNSHWSPTSKAHKSIIPLFSWYHLMSLALEFSW